MPQTQPESKSNLTDAQRDELQRALERKLDELRRTHRGNVATGTRMDEALAEHMDVASRETSSAESLGLAEQELALIEEIEGALERMELGTYGISELTGEPIPFRRLEAVPWARNDAHEEEAEARRRGRS